MLLYFTICYVAADYVNGVCWSTSARYGARKCLKWRRLPWLTPSHVVHSCSSFRELIWSLGWWVCSLGHSAMTESCSLVVAGETPRLLVYHEATYSIIHLLYLATHIRRQNITLYKHTHSRLEMWMNIHKSTTFLRVLVHSYKHDGAFLVEVIMLALNEASPQHQSL